MAENGKLEKMLILAFETSVKKLKMAASMDAKDSLRH